MPCLVDIPGRPTLPWTRETKTPPCGGDEMVWGGDWKKGRKGKPRLVWNMWEKNTFFKKIYCRKCLKYIKSKVKERKNKCLFHITRNGSFGHGYELLARTRSKTGFDHVKTSERTISLFFFYPNLPSLDFLLPFFSTCTGYTIEKLRLYKSG